ncbi:MAG TPA: glycosyltransferase family 9 protein [Candidatus Krumholzibacteria bacterium]|nr:glycosyltransferase family 9 protein [Candidatus Krumholzibacteria bacterium]
MAFDPASVRRIVVLGPNKPFWGAGLVQLPFYAALRRACPGAEVTVVSPVPQASLFVDLGLADHLEVIDRRRLGPTLAAVRRAHPDLVLSLRDRSLQANLAAALSGARRRAGFDRPLNRLLLGRTAPVDTGRYMAFRYLGVLEAAGIRHHGLDDLADLFPPVPVDLPRGHPLFVFMPGGGQPEKRWGIANFLRLAELLGRSHAGAVFVFVLGPDERGDLPAIEAGLPASRRRVLLEQPAGAIVAAARAARAVVANDCGPSHLAQLCGVPYVGLFGAFDAHTDRRIAEWFHRHERARVLVPAAGAPLTALPPEAVARAVAEITVA